MSTSSFQVNLLLSSNENMKLRILVWSITSALAGFLFGFDTVVISGAENTIQRLWGLSDGLHGFATASALYGTVLGSLLGSWPADRFGRKPTLLVLGVMYVVSAIGCGLAWDVWSFMVFRMLGGVGIGVSTVVAPLYITEIAPAAYRGRLTALFQFNIVFGIIVAYGSNWLLAGVGENAWRWMLGVAAFPSLAYLMACLAIPESPRWLLTVKRDRAAGLGVLKLMYPDWSPAELDAEAETILSAEAANASTGGFWSRRLLRPILLAVLIAMFNQLSGINAVLYFAPRILEGAELSASEALRQSIGLGITNLIFTFVGLWLIDRLGRRTLMLIGSVGYIASLGLTAWAFSTQQYTLVPWFLFAFIGAHAIGQGTVIWVFISEIFPNRHRATGQAVGSLTHWVFAAAITTVFPLMIGQFDREYVFLFFAGIMVLQLLWVLLVMPETKGMALEDVERQLVEDQP